MIWRAFKFLLSAACLLVSTLLILYVLIGKGADDFAMFCAAGFLYLAAVPWIDITKPTRAGGLAGIVLSLFVLVWAFKTATGNEIYPMTCFGRGALICELQNFLYDLGGRPAAAIPVFLFAIAAFYFSIIVFKRTRSD